MAVFFLCACSLTAHAQWTQAWGDDFNGSSNTAYNHSLWANEVKVNTGNVWGDGTIMSTSDSLSNVYLDGNGNLVIAMTYNANPGSGQTNYTSARLKSLPTTGVGPYGQIETRIQNPSAVGMGAAFWAMGADNATGTPWPWCGELDMMEIQAKTNQHNGSTIHGGETDSQTSYEYGGLSTTVDLTGSATFDNGFHVFTTQWAPYHLQYFLDGAQYGDYGLTDIGATDQWEMENPYVFILSSGIGGNGGTPNGQGFPSNMLVDYVHYSKWSAGAPAPVTALKATATNSNAVSLSWTASTTSNVVYNVYASTTQGTAPSLATLVIEGVTGTSYIHTGLQPSTTYYYTVVSSNWGGESTASKYTATTQAPGNSTGIQLSAGGYGVGTYMTSNFVLGGNTNFHHNTVVDTSAVSNPAPQKVYNTERWGAAAWTITGLNPGAGYNVRLHFVEFAQTGSGMRNFNVSINSASVLSNFDIYATAGAQNKAIVEQFFTLADENGIIEIQTTKGTTSVTDLNPTINAIEIIPASGTNPVGAAPGTTTDLAINSGSTSAVGNFIADEDYNGGDTSSKTATVSTSGVANAAPAAVYQSERYVPFTYVLTGLVADATYTVNMHFAETYWTAAGKRIFNVALNGNQVITNLDVWATVGINKALVKQFSTNADMYGQIIVQLIYGGADQPFISGIEVIKTANSCTTAPGTPTGLSGTATSSSAISLSWNGVAAPTGCSGVTYSLYGSTTSGFTPGSGNLIASGLATASYNNTGLNSSTTYYYKVVAVDVAGSSAPSTQAAATTQGAACSAVPSAPTGLTATTSSSSAINLSWNAVTPPANCSISSYTVYRSTTSGFTPGSGNLIASISGASYSDSGLTASTTYYYKVEASDSDGTSPASSQAQATTLTNVGTDFIAIASGGPAESNSGGGDASFIADTDVSGGNAGSSTTKTITLTQPGLNAAPMGVYQHQRNGTITYTIPGMTANSQHTVLLHFAELYFSASGKRVFNVAINSAPVLSNFDVYANVGRYAALVEQFTATANASGQIVITFTKGTADQPTISGIEIR